MIWNSGLSVHVIFFFQAEDGIRDADVTGVQTCALPISKEQHSDGAFNFRQSGREAVEECAFAEAPGDHLLVSVDHLVRINIQESEELAREGPLVAFSNSAGTHGKTWASPAKAEEMGAFGDRHFDGAGNRQGHDRVSELFRDLFERVEFVQIHVPRRVADVLPKGAPTKLAVSFRRQHKAVWNGQVEPIPDFSKSRSFVTGLPSRGDIQLGQPRRKIRAAQFLGRTEMTFYLLTLGADRFGQHAKPFAGQALQGFNRTASFLKDRGNTAAQRFARWRRELEILLDGSQEFEAFVI